MSRSRRESSSSLSLFAVATGLILVLLPGCSRNSRTSLDGVVAAGAARGANVVLVTIDTARRDHFGCYGDENARTPVVDALARGGVLVEDAVSSVPLTLPSHATILTGRYPPRLGVHDNGLDRLGPGPSTLPESLRAHGYATAAFVGAFVLDARFGLDRGFDHYDFEVSEAGYHPQMTEFNERQADAVTDSTLAWLDRHVTGDPGRPFFTWVHYFDPHLPYMSPLQSLSDLRGRPYDAEIAYADQQLGRIVAWLDRRGLRDRTLVVVTADHGESLGEHRENTHGMFVYDATLHVPLVLSCPALFEGPLKIADRVVGLVDIRATIEDLLGVASGAGGDGVSLLDAAPPERAIYIETEGPLRMAGCSPLRGVRTHTAKFIEAPEPEYYDLEHDPAELRNLYASSPQLVAPLRAQLEATLAGEAAPATPQRRLSEDERTRLRSLGYTFSPAKADSGALPDPKWQIAIFNDGMEAEALYGQGQYEAAAKLARKVTGSCPECMNAVRVLAFSEMRLGRADDAVAILREAVERDSDPFLVRSLVQMQILTGDLDGALATIDLHAGQHPGDGWFPLLRGDCLASQGRYQAALESYRKAAAIDPHRSGRRAAERIRETERKVQGAPGGD